MPQWTMRENCHILKTAKGTATAEDRGSCWHIVVFKSSHKPKEEFLFGHVTIDKVRARAEYLLKRIDSANNTHVM